MHALIVYAHPEPTSFTAAMRDAACDELVTHGVTVEVSDLYRDRFNPVGGRRDFLTAADPARFHYQQEQLHAARTGTFAPDVRREQARVAAADLLLMVFPMWWGGPPAILKGWFDRVLAYGFAYEDGMRYDTGYFRGRAGLLGVTTGGTPRRYSTGGTYGTIQQVLWPTQHCLLEYLGLSTGEPYVAYATPRVSGSERVNYLNQWRHRVRELSAQDVIEKTRPSRPAAAASTTSWDSPS